MLFEHSRYSMTEYPRAWSGGAGRASRSRRTDLLPEHTGLCGLTDYASKGLILPNTVCPAPVPRFEDFIRNLGFNRRSWSYCSRVLGLGWRRRHVSREFRRAPRPTVSILSHLIFVGR